MRPLENLKELSWPAKSIAASPSPLRCPFIAESAIVVMFKSEGGLARKLFWPSPIPTAVSFGVCLYAYLFGSYTAPCSGRRAPMFGAFRPSHVNLGGLLWCVCVPLFHPFFFRFPFHRKSPWRLSTTRKANARDRLKKVDAVIEAVRSSGVECAALVGVSFFNSLRF